MAATQIVKLNLRLSPELNEKIMKVANKSMLSRTDVVRQALFAYLDHDAA